MHSSAEVPRSFDLVNWIGRIRQNRNFQAARGRSPMMEDRNGDFAPMSGQKGVLAVKRLFWISCCLLAVGACAPGSWLIQSPNSSVSSSRPERLPPTGLEPPKCKKTIWQRIFPPEDERRANALPEDNRWHGVTGDAP